MGRFKQHGYLNHDAGYFLRSHGEDYFRGPNYTVRVDVHPLFSLKFWSPPVQAFPETAAGVAGTLGATPSFGWRLNGAAGSVADFVADGCDMDVLNSPVRDQNAAVFNGTDWKSVRVAESREGTFDGFIAANSAVGDLSSSVSSAIALVFRAGKAPSTNYCMAEKRDTAFGAGYEIRAAGGGFTFLAENSATAAIQLAYNDSNLWDGAWHVAIFVFDVTAGEMRIVTDLGNVSAARVITGDYSSVNALRLMTGFNRNGMDHQLAYAALFSGAQAEAITDLGNFWTLGADVTGKLTTATHSSLLSDTVADDATIGEVVSHWHGAGVHGIDHLPYGYHAANTKGPNALGNWLAVTNLVADSEDFNGAWALNGTATFTSNNGPSPDGFNRATLVSAAATNDATTSPNITVATSTTYCESVWLRADSAHTATLEYRNSTVSVATQNVSVTTKWKRFTFVFTSDAIDTVCKLRVYPTEKAVGGAGNVEMWGAQLVAGSVPGRYARTFGGTAVLSKTVHRFTGSIKPEAGEVHAHVICTDLVTAAVRQVWDTVGNPDRRRAAILATHKWYAEMRNDIGTSFFAPSSGTGGPTVDTEHEHVLLWQNLDERLIVDGTQELSDSDNYTFTATMRDLCIGGDNTDAGQLNGYISQIDIYDEAIS